eukprot:scaffold7210_cov63-Attheya_sp.AAC.2
MVHLAWVQSDRYLAASLSREWVKMVQDLAGILYMLEQFYAASAASRPAFCVAAIFLWRIKDNGVTFDHNLRLTLFLDYNSRIHTCTMEYAKRYDSNRRPRWSYL